MAAGDIIIPDNTITPEILDQIAAEVQNRRSQTAKDPNDWEEVSSLVGVSSLPVFQVSGSVYKLVRVALSVLKGVDGSDGQDGADGKTPQITIGTVTNGDTASATLTADGVDDNGNPKYKLNLVLPKGDKGDTGATGETGEQGAQGDPGKTVKMGTVTVTSGQTPSGSFTQNGTDGEGNPIYDLSLVVQKGDNGKDPVFEQGTTTTLNPGEEAYVEVVPNGNTEEGNPKYTLNFSIPRGQQGAAGTGSGNVYVEGTGLESGKQYLFVPGANGSTTGTFVEYTAPVIPEQVQPDWNATEGKGAILNKPVIPTKTSDLQNDDNTVKDDAYVHTDNNYTSAEKTKLGKLNFVPTLDYEPGETDLTFTDSEGTHNFQIGDLARVADSESEQGYAFYQLYDITSENKAVWAKSGTGGGVSVLTEKLVLTLTSNQAQPDASLNGLVVHVKYGDNDTPLTWNGTAMTTEIPMDTTYQIEYPTLAGYATPETAEYIALAGNTRTVEASYNATILTINIDSNQTDKSDLSNVQITLSGSISKILDYEGDALTLKVPTGKTLTITPSQLDGYATVSAIEKTPEAATESVDFTYNTTIMSITLSSNQGTDSTLNAGTQVTVKCGSVNKQLTWTGTVLKEKLPTGQAYTITPAALEGYKTPDAKSGIASGASMSETLLYQTEVVTVTVNADNSTSVNGQQVTINNQQYNYSGSPISVKIPFGTSYSVSVNAKSGYTTPSAQQFTANQATRAVTMTYLEIKRGIFILDTDGNLVKRTEWNTGNNSKAVGVAVLSDNCKFVISKTQGGSMTWGGYGTTISGIVTTTDANTAKKDYAGKDNTEKIVMQLGGSNAAAASYCRNTSNLFPGGRKGYLGSLGEWQEAYNNKSEIDACMSLIGGTAIATNYYHWTSTQYSSDHAWILNWSDAHVYGTSKGGSRQVRAFAAL